MNKIITPGAPGPRPVDPTDPTKGVINEVYNAQTLTAAVNELADRTERLAGGLVNLMQVQNSLSLEVGALLEQIATLLLPLSEMSGTTRTDDEEAASKSLYEFVEAREVARAEFEAQVAAQEAAVEEVKADVEAGETPNLFVVS